MKIYLASKSPRRKELLTQMGVDFEVLQVDTPEILQPHETPAAYSKRVTQEKLAAAWETMLEKKLPILPVLCADTEVILDNAILGKPRGHDDALNMLKNYSDRDHEVITSVGVKYFNHRKVVMNRTIVTFSILPDEAIHHYLQLSDYQDKSGGYGIQSYIGQFISKIEGCFYSVMGLPLNTTRELLAQIKSISVGKKSA